MDAKLVVVSGEAQASEYTLSLPTIVGRSRSADIKIGHPLVSRKHCELFESEGQLAIRDLGSLNGTFVGESRISDATVVPPGGMLTVGAVTFQAIYGNMSEAGEAENGDFPDFMAAAPALAATAAPIEQTLEMSEVETPVTEPTSGVDRDAGIDFGWLEEPSEEPEPEQPQAKAAPKAAAAPASEPVVVESAQAEADEVEVEVAEVDELILPDPSHAEQNGAAENDEINEFAPPAEPAAAGGEDDDLSDFFASLK